MILFNHMVPTKCVPILIAFLLCLISHQPLLAQQQPPKFYLGLSFGTSFSLGDFADTDISNPDAGFAKDGRRFDAYGGYFLGKSKRTTLTAIFRAQTFETEIEELVENLRADDPSVDLTASTEDWQVYSFLVGLAYKVDIGRKFNFFPRLGIGPLFATNPGIVVNAPNAVITNNFERSSEAGAGLGYEFGVGFKTDIGKRLSLLPTFTFSGGFVTIKDVVTTTDNVSVNSDYQPNISSFNIGLSLGYRFY